MKPRRWAIAGLAAAALTFSTAGCSTGKNDTPGGGTTPSATPAADPKVVLAKAAQELTKASFKISGKTKGSTIQSSIDPVAKHVVSTIVQGDPGQQITVDIVVVAGDPFVKVQFGALAQVLGLGPLDNKWLHVDQTKITNTKSFGITAVDPADAALLFTNVVTVASAGPGRYTGTIDLTKAPKAGLADEDTVTDLADQAKAIPFEAAVDDKGRLTSLKLTIPTTAKVTAQTWEATFSDFGTPVSATKPAGAIETPAALYELFNQS